MINGAVNVTMSQPALVAVDIDGQMDSRDTPRATPTGFNETAFPHRNELNGVHAVTIFANTVIVDKPLPNCPDVYAVEPGTLPPPVGRGRRSISNPADTSSPWIKTAMNASGRPPTPFFWPTTKATTFRVMRSFTAISMTSTTT